MRSGGPKRRLFLDNVRICRGLPGLAEFDDNREVIRPGDGLNKVAAVCLPRPKWMSVGGRRLWSLGILCGPNAEGRSNAPSLKKFNARPRSVDRLPPIAL